MSRSGCYRGQGLPIQEGVDQGALPHIRPPQENDLGVVRWRHRGEGVHHCAQGDSRYRSPGDELIRLRIFSHVGGGHDIEDLEDAGHVAPLRYQPHQDVPTRRTGGAHVPFLGSNDGLLCQLYCAVEADSGRRNLSLRIAALALPGVGARGCEDGRLCLRGGEGHEEVHGRVKVATVHNQILHILGEVIINGLTCLLVHRQSRFGDKKRDCTPLVPFDGVNCGHRLPSQTQLVELD
mmetsp:Transcript_116704/g.260690  ORF Transcript_116704/g.260690 Transcript_116704/m.260690 type:complete len:236 (-) Transcript_116704:55-762(-)